MSNEKTAAKKKGKYYVTAVRSQMYEFEVDAMSPEGACKALYERLKRDISEGEPEKARLIGNSWSNPSEKGEVCTIEGGELPFDKSCQVTNFWDGGRIFSATVDERYIQYVRKGR